MLTRGAVPLVYGKNKEGYWDYEMFEQQTVDFMDTFEALHPDWQLEWEIDWSSGHAKYRAGALNVNSMGVKYGGKQRTPRESKIPADPAEAAFYLGPHEAKMKWHGKVIDRKLKPGEIQHFYFKVCLSYSQPCPYSQPSGLLNPPIHTSHSHRRATPRRSMT